MAGHELPSKFTENSAAGSYKPVTDIIAAAKSVAPEDRVASGYDAPAAPGDSAVVRFAAPLRDSGNQAGGRPGPQTRVRVDPVTLAAKIAQPAAGPNAPNQGFNFMRLMPDLHGRMLIEGAAGRQFVGWLGVFMCGLGLSGIVMWWPRPGQWTAAFKVRSITLPANPEQALSRGIVTRWRLHRRAARHGRGRPVAEESRRRARSRALCHRRQVPGLAGPAPCGQWSRHHSGGDWCS